MIIILDRSGEWTICLANAYIGWRDPFVKIKGDPIDGHIRYIPVQRIVQIYRNYPASIMGTRRRTKGSKNRSIGNRDRRVYLAAHLNVFKFEIPG